MQIIPSILVSTQEEFLEQLNSVQNILNQVQLDIADGIFVPETTWALPNIVKENAKINVELHLMVENPLNELTRWTDCQPINRVLIHLESKQVEEAIKFAKNNNWEIGLVLKPETSLTELEKYLPQIDTVMFMGVIPGKQAQKLIPEVLEKIKIFINQYPNIFTELDGGVNENTLATIYESGIQAICPGSAIFHNEKTPEKNIREITKLINKLTN